MPALKFLVLTLKLCQASSSFKLVLALALKSGIISGLPDTFWEELLKTSKFPYLMTPSYSSISLGLVAM